MSKITNIYDDQTTPQPAISDELVDEWYEQVGPQSEDAVAIQGPTDPYPTAVVTEGKSTRSIVGVKAIHIDTTDFIVDYYVATPGTNVRKLTLDIGMDVGLLMHPQNKDLFDLVRALTDYLTEHAYNYLGAIANGPRVLHGTEVETVTITRDKLEEILSDRLAEWYDTTQIIQEIRDATVS